MWPANSLDLKPVDYLIWAWCRSVCIEYQSAIHTSCGSGLLRHGLYFSRACWTMQLINSKIDGKHVSLQKMVTLNSCSDVACLTFKLPHITIGSFQSLQCHTTYHSHQHLEENNTPSIMDADLSVWSHVLRTAAGCFAVLHRIKSIRRSLTKPVLQSLLVALVLSRLDYGSIVLFGLPQQLVDKLQSVQNAAAWLTHAARRCDHISPLLQGLHWLQVADRITFQLAVLTYRCLHSWAPEYLSRQLQRVADVHTHQRLRSSSSTVLVISRTCRATIGGEGFTTAATSVWNSLPEAVRSSTSLSLFKKSLKTKLFTRSYID